MSLDGFSVRRAVATDLTGVVLLERGIAEAPHWAEAEYRVMISAVDTKDGVRRRLLVAKYGDRLVGFAVGKVLGSFGELESVAVAGEARRTGCGRALCRAVVEWCRDEGASEVDLEVRAGSAGAIRLYEGLGFERVGLRPRYYRGPEEDAVLMQMKLAG